jgi:UDP-3-O-[3-hydroxymyristoyl] glucosamine N-acyltransferase
MHSIILVGCDKDLIFDTRHLATKIAGYTAMRSRPDVPYRYLGEVRNLGCLSSSDRLLVTVDDVKLRQWILSAYPNNLYTYMSPGATISENAFVAAGVVIQNNCFVSSGVTISSLAKINVGCQIHHDSAIGNCSVIAPAVVLLGHSRIGERTYVGAGSVVRERTSIGDDCTIGMGSTVVKSIGSNLTAFGNPCVERGIPSVN